MIITSYELYVEGYNWYGNKCYCTYNYNSLDDVTARLGDFSSITFKRLMEITKEITENELMCEGEYEGLENEEFDND